MERIIIIDDNSCKKELADFLEAHKEHIRYNSSLVNFRSTANGIFEELVSHPEAKDKLAIDSHQRIDIVHTRDISYIEALGSKSGLHFSNGSYLETSGSLSSFEEKLKGRNFITIQNRFLLNLGFFLKFIMGEHPEIILVTGESLPVNREGIEPIINYLNSLEI